MAFSWDKEKGHPEMAFIIFLKLNYFFTASQVVEPPPEEAVAEQESSASFLVALKVAPSAVAVIPATVVVHLQA